MYSVLIVDDEALVRRGISTMIDWSSLGFSAVYQAEDGLAALEVMRAHSIQLVLTDIVMPHLDGMALCREIRRAFPATHIVVLTGHEDFEYAKQSVDLGVKNYILKPVGASTLFEKMQAVCKRLHMEAEQKRYIEDMKHKLQQSMPALREKYLYSLVCTQRGAGDGYAQRFRELEIDLCGGPFVVGIVEPELSVGSGDFELYFVATKDIVHSCLGDGHCILDDNASRIIILFNLQSIEQSEAHGVLNDTLHVIQKAIASTLRMDATCALSAPVADIEGLFKGYRQACMALECRYALGPNRVYDIGDLDYIDKTFYYPLYGPEQLLVGIKYGTSESIVAAVRGIAEDLLERNLSSANFRMLLTEIVTQVLREVGNLKNAPEAIWQQGFRLYTSLEQLHSGTEALEELTAFCLQVAELFHSVQVSSSQQIVERVKEYVAQNYHDPELSLATAAAHAAVSTGYLSVLFKKDTGTNFVKFLAEVRMRAAMELLRGTDKRTYEIAYETGFANPHYFSVAFKKHTGLSPSEFRGAPGVQEGE